MSIPTVQLVQEQRPANETAEVKQRVQQYVVDDALSEWEVARQTSKTWSMEQD